MPKTINLEPGWEGLRRYLLHMARTDLATARKIAAEMGSEAPADEDLVEQYERFRVRPDGPETARGGLIGQQPY